MPTPALPMTPAFARRLSGRPLVLLLDVDGTLAAIAPRPDYAVLTPETRRVLTELTRLTDVHVAVISGRAAADAARVVSVDGTWSIGNHGLEVARPGEPATAHPDAARFAGRIAAAAARCRECANTIPGVIVEDKRWSLSVHYRLAHPQIVPELVAGVASIARDLGLRTTQGKEVIEVRPPIDADKGTAAVELASLLGALRPGASLLCAGDDRTDEDAFRALRAAQPHFVTVRVGDESTAIETAAEFSLPDSDALRILLEAIVEPRRAIESRR